MNTLDPKDRLELSDVEQRGLDSWVTAYAPTDLTRKAMQRYHGAQRAKRMRVIVAAAAVVLVAVATSLFALRAPNASGSFEAHERLTVDLGGRAVAVAETGANVEWQVKSGSARVLQTKGDVFYRVERGGSFVVKTPAGEVAVLGTCFRVAVERDVIVSVYEGKVRVMATDSAETLVVQPGQRARVRRGASPKLVRAAAVTTPQPKRTSKAVHSLSEPGKYARLSRENAHLRTVVENLKRQLGKVETGGGLAVPKKAKLLSPSKDELIDRAKRCRLLWDTLSQGFDTPTIRSQHRRQLGLDDNEVVVMNAVLAKSYRRHVAQLRKLYIEVTGDTKTAESLSPSALISEIQQKSPRVEVQAVFQRLSRERAGLEPAPATTSGASAVERLMRHLVSEGDRVERAMAKKIGRDLARRHRELNDGYGSRSGSSFGCPKPSQP